MRVLVLKPDHLGDFVLAMPSLWEVRQKIGRGGKLDVAASLANAEWLAMFDWIDRIVSIRHPRYARPRKKFAPIGFSRMLAKGFSLRTQRYDYGVDLTSSPNDPWGKLFLISAGASRRSGARGSYDFLLSEKHAFDAGHQTEILAARFPKELQIAGKARPSEFMPPHLRWENQKHENVILFSPWAGTRAKEWASERWHELLRNFSQDFSVKILTTADRMEETIKICGERSDCMALVNSIPDTLRWLCRAQMVVTVDSATAHFAWLTGTPLAQLFSGTTEPERWASFGARARLEAFPVCYPCHLENCNQPYHYCMQDISVERVIQAVQKIL